MTECLAYSDHLSLTLRFANMSELTAFIAKRWGEKAVCVVDTDPTNTKVCDVWKDLESAWKASQGDTIASPVASVRQMTEEKAKDLLFETHSEDDWN
jgi:hypothetical protein